MKKEYKLSYETAPQPDGTILLQVSIEDYENKMVYSYRFAKYFCDSLVEKAIKEVHGEIIQFVEEIATKKGNEFNEVREVIFFNNLDTDIEKIMFNNEGLQ